ncbi:MAG: chemotaxis protein CheC [Chloroflexota bacterium]|nr:chemotaxis protein CheC [Chloroflexota bacterium]
MSTMLTLEALQLDALREVASIGAGHAATALSQMTNHKIMINVPRITIAIPDDIAAQVDPREEPVAGVLMHMLGDLTGRTVLIFPRGTALRLAALMLQCPTKASAVFGELEQSAIKEAGNILSGAYMNALSDFMGMMLIPSPPALAVDMSAAVVSTACLQSGAGRDCIFAVETQFSLEEIDERLRGFFLLLPDPASLQAILRAIGVA